MRMHRSVKFQWNPLVHRKRRQKDKPLTSEKTPPIINYDSTGRSTYKTDFWEGKGREYEDRVERIAIKRLLHPWQGQRLLELGAGFGRLSDFYSGYDQVVVLDYARTQLEDARARLGDSKYLYVAADIYRLPIAEAACDAATMIRVLHHFVDVPAALAQIRQALSPGAVFVLEYANKRNLKAMLRYAIGQQDWNPYSPDPIEFVKLNFDFHPRFIEQHLQALGFETQQKLAVSYFRLGLLKQTVPPAILASLDRALQGSGLLYSPSVFTRNLVSGMRPVKLPAQVFKCPNCHSTDLQEQGEVVYCAGCENRYSKAGGIYDFREAI